MYIWDKYTATQLQVIRVPHTLKQPSAFSWNKYDGHWTLAVATQGGEVGVWTTKPEDTTLSKSEDGEKEHPQLVITAPLPSANEEGDLENEGLNRRNERPPPRRRSFARGIRNIANASIGTRLRAPSIISRTEDTTVMMQPLSRPPSILSANSRVDSLVSAEQPHLQPPRARTLSRISVRSIGRFIRAPSMPTSND